MSAISFTCPGCQQTLEAQPEYAGMQVTCPTCQTAMIVPQVEAPAPAAPSAPPGKYSKAPSPSQHAPPPPGPGGPAGRPRKKKKINYALYAEIAGGIALVAAGIYFGPQLLDKYHHHQADVAAAEMARTNPPPPPPPPDLGAEEILKKVTALYKGLPSYSVHGETIATMDMSQINPILTQPIQTKASFTMLLGRPNEYRIDWQHDMAGRTLKGSAWSTGKGDFIQIAGAPSRVKNRETAFAQTAGASGTMGVYLASSFFEQANSIDAALKMFSKTNNETLDSHKCYVLVGEMGFQKMLFWIHKDDFLVQQAECILGGKIDDSILAGLNGVQKRQAQAAAKMRGNIIETYDNIETNRNVTASDFQVALAVPQHVNKPRRMEEPGAPGRPQRQTR